MKKVTLKLSEIYSLYADLNGVINQQTQEVLVKGLLAEKIKMSTKYWLNELAKKITIEKETIEKIREDLIKKYGDKDEKGNISIPTHINIVKNENDEPVSGDINPKLVEFQNEFYELLQEEKEIEYKSFTLDEFENVETEGNYNTFFKLITVDEQIS